MPNAFGTWGYRLEQIADAVWTRTVRQLSDVDNVKTVIADSVWTRTVRQLSDVNNVKASISADVWAYTNRVLTNATNITTPIADAVWTRTTRTITDATNIRDAVWTATTRTLTAGVDLSSSAISGIWNATTRSLTAAVDILQSGADRVWASVSRTLTAPVQITYAVPSANIKASADTERTAAGITPIKLKELQVGVTGVIRVSFEIHATSSVTAGGKIYVNSVDTGMGITTKSETYVVYSADISVKAGDFVQLYAYSESTSYPAYIRNLRISYDISSTSPSVILN